MYTVPLINPFSLTQVEFVEALFERLGKGKEHIALYYRQLMRHGKIDPLHPLFVQNPQLLHAIEAHTTMTQLQVVDEIKQTATHKALFQLNDGAVIESVAIPMSFGFSLCISSQVGCRMGCRFCQTARMGLVRNLTTEEIVAQFWHMRHLVSACKTPHSADLCPRDEGLYQQRSARPIRNIVFMGMGEPFDNLNAVLQAIRVLTDTFGCGIGMSRITISTSGRVDGIYRLIDEAHPAINLAVSINAPNDTIRGRLMPINRKFNMAALKEAMLAYCEHPRRSILAEYILIDGVTDQLEHAKELCDYLKGIRAKINLIPYNPQRSFPFGTSSKQQVDMIANYLKSQGLQVLVRQTKGDAIMAACGQLGERFEKIKAYVR